jgi:hypothetical protein
MNDVKDLFGRVLDADTPRPVATRDDMLAVARRAAARRRARHLTAACASVALVVGAATAAPHWLGRDDDGLTTGDHSSVTAAPSHPAATPRLAPERHATAMLKALLKHVPGDLTTPSAPTIKGNDGVEYQVQGTHVESPAKQILATTDIYSGKKAGSLTATVTVGQGPVPTGDLCATASISHDDTEQGCRTITATNGLPVRFSWRYLSIGRTEYAARYYPGGYVLIQQLTYGLKPASTPLGLVMTERALADAAADPAFWPKSLAPFS